MTRNRTLLLLIALPLLSGCAISMSSLMRRTPPQDCMREVEPLKRLETGSQVEEELWIADAAPKYQALAKDYNCLREWANEDPNDAE